LKQTLLIRAAGFLAALFFFLILSPEPQIVQITFLGDVMLGRGINQAASRTTNWQPFMKLRPVIRWADILAANLESPLTTSPVVTSGYALCAPPERAEALQAASFDLVTLANNHTLDCGDAGITQTQSTLQFYGIQSAGPISEPVFFNSHGEKLAFMALDDISSPVDLSRVIPLVESTAHKADGVIISIHWGSEYQSAPSSRQRNMATALANAGADVIIGHHPHVIQPMEKLLRDNGKPPTLVFYSLGNALFDQHGLPDTRTGEAVNLMFGPGGTIRYSINTFEIDPIKGVIRGVLP
jgi:gamma-polyglutamate biosynthesis protein CapA